MKMDFTVPTMNLPPLADKYPVCGFSRIEARRVIWELTSVCNRACYYCFAASGRSVYRKKHVKRLKFSEILESARKLRALGYADIQLTGGEIFLLHDILEIIRELSKIGFTLALSTNCDFLTENHMKQILALNVRSLNVSLDSNIPSVNDEIRGEDAFDNTLKVIRQVVGKAIRLRVHTVVTKYNRLHIDEVPCFLYQLGVRLHTISSELPSIEPYDPALTDRLYEAQYKCQGMEIGLLRIKLSPTQEPHEWTGCSRGSSLIGIYPDGTMTPCTLYLNQNPLNLNIYRDDLYTIEQALKQFDQDNRPTKKYPCVSPFAHF